jgi:hypothetical protein
MYTELIDFLRQDFTNVPVLENVIIFRSITTKCIFITAVSLQCYVDETGLYG